MADRIITNTTFRQDVADFLNVRKENLTMEFLRNTYNKEVQSMYVKCRTLKRADLFIEFFKSLKLDKKVEFSNKALENKYAEVLLELNHNNTITYKLFIVENEKYNRGFINTCIYNGKEYRSFSLKKTEGKQSLAKVISKELILDKEDLDEDYNNFLNGVLAGVDYLWYLY